MDRIDEILSSFRKWAMEKMPIDADTWLDGALHLNALLDSVDDKLSEMDADMIQEQGRLIEEGESVSGAKIMCKRAIDYSEYLKLKAKRERIQEFIRLAKKKAVLSNSRMFEQ